MGEPLTLHKGLKKAGSLRLSLCKDAVSCFACSLEPVPVPAAVLAVPSPGAPAPALAEPLPRAELAQPVGAPGTCARAAGMCVCPWPAWLSLLQGQSGLIFHLHPLAKGVALTSSQSCRTAALTSLPSLLLLCWGPWLCSPRSFQASWLLLPPPELFPCSCEASSGPVDPPMGAAVLQPGRLLNSECEAAVSCCGCGASLASRESTPPALRAGSQTGWNNSAS